MAFRIQLRRDTADNWTTENPILLEGEMGYETDSRITKIGNGTDQYNSLPVWSVGTEQLQLKQFLLD